MSPVNHCKQPSGGPAPQSTWKINNETNSHPDICACLLREYLDGAGVRRAGEEEGDGGAAGPQPGVEVLASVLPAQQGRTGAVSRHHHQAVPHALPH